MSKLCFNIVYILLTTYSGYIYAQDFVFKPHQSITDTAYLFAHGLRSTCEQVTILQKLKDPLWIIDGPLATFNFPDAIKKKHECDKKLVNLGQELDIQHFLEAHESIFNHVKETCKVVWLGISRGAATVLNAAAISEKHPHAVIVECPFDTLKSVIKHLLKRFRVHWVPFSETVGMKIANKQFPLFNKNGIFPLNMVKDIPKELPILLIHSKRDNVVPVSSSRRLYIELVKTGHINTYLLELASGKHAEAIRGKDGKCYTYAVHAFYKAFDLPYDETFAQKGYYVLNASQPTIEEVKERIRKRKRDIRSAAIELEDSYEEEDDDDDLDPDQP